MMFPDSGFRNYEKYLIPLLILGTTIVALGVERYAISLGFYFVFANLLMIPGVLLAYYYTERGLVVFTCGMVALALVFLTFFGGYGYELHVVAPRVALFVIISAIVAHLSMRLKEEKQKYASIFERIGTAVIIRNQDERIAMANRQASELLGYSEDELIGRPVTDLIAEEDLPTARVLDDRFKKMAISEVTPVHPIVNEDLLFVRKDREIRDTSVSMGYMPDSMNVIISFSDITEKKQAKLLLKEHEEYLRSIFDTALVGIIIVDTETQKIVDLNNNAAGMIGLPAEAIKGTDCHQYLSTPEGENGDNKLITASGAVVPVLKTVSKIMLNGRKHLLETFIDVSDIKEALEEIERRGAVLEVASESADCLLKQSEWKKCIPKTLSGIGNALMADRVVLYKKTIDQNTGVTAMEQVHLWRRDEDKPLPDYLQTKLLSLSKQCSCLKRWEDVFSNGESIVGAVSTLPEEEQIFFKNSTDASIAIVPIFAGEEWWGLLGFTTEVVEHEWAKAEIDSLSLAAGIIGSAVERDNTYTMLLAYIREGSLRLKNPVDFITQNLVEIIDELEGAEDEEVEMQYILTQLKIQVKNAEQIIFNLRELNQAIVGMSTEIPEDFRTFLTQ